MVRVRGGRRSELIGTPGMLKRNRVEKTRVEGVNYTCMRGQYDLLPVKNRKPVAYFILFLRENATGASAPSTA